MKWIVSIQARQGRFGVAGDGGGEDGLGIVVEDDIICELELDVDDVVITFVGRASLYGRHVLVSEKRMLSL